MPSLFSASKKTIQHAVFRWRGTLWESAVTLCLISVIYRNPSEYGFSILTGTPRGKRSRLVKIDQLITGYSITGYPNICKISYYIRSIPVFLELHLTLKMEYHKMRDTIPTQSWSCLKFGKVVQFLELGWLQKMDMQKYHHGWCYWIFTEYSRTDRQREKPKPFKSYSVIKQPFVK